MVRQGPRLAGYCLMLLCSGRPPRLQEKAVRGRSGVVSLVEVMRSVWSPSSRPSTSMYTEVRSTGPVAAPVRDCTWDDLVLGNWTSARSIPPLSYSLIQIQATGRPKTGPTVPYHAPVAFSASTQSPALPAPMRRGKAPFAAPAVRVPGTGQDRAPSRALIGCDETGHPSR